MAGRPSNEAIASGPVMGMDERRGAILRRPGVSPMTLRRDLEDLERAGLPVRIRGGAVRPAAASPVVVDTEEPQAQRRLGRALAAKEAVAAQACAPMAAARTLALDIGTTTLRLARRLTERRHLTVFTKNLRIAQVLADAAPEVCLAGSRVRPIEQAVGGPAAMAQFGAPWFDAAMIGVPGVSAEGFCDYAFQDTDLKRVVFAPAARRIVLADSGKFHRRSLIEAGRLAEATDLVSDAPPPEPLAGALHEAGLRLHLAKAQP